MAKMNLSSSESGLSETIKTILASDRTGLGTTRAQTLEQTVAAVLAKIRRATASAESDEETNEAQNPVAALAAARGIDPAIVQRDVDALLNIQGTKYERAPQRHKAYNAAFAAARKDGLDREELMPFLYAKHVQTILTLRQTEFKNNTERKKAYRKAYAEAARDGIEKSSLIRYILAREESPTVLQTEQSSYTPAARWTRRFDGALADPRTLFKDQGIITNALEAAFRLDVDDNIALAIKDPLHRKRMELVAWFQFLSTNGTTATYGRAIDQYEQRLDFHAEFQTSKKRDTLVTPTHRDVDDAVDGFRNVFAHVFRVEPDHPNTRSMSQLTLLHPQAQPYLSAADRADYDFRAGLTVGAELKKLNRQQHIDYYKKLGARMLELGGPQEPLPPGLE